MKLQSSIAALSILAIASLSACGPDISVGSKEGKALDEEQSIPVDTSATGKLVLANSNGNITVIGEAGREEIQMVPTLNSDDPEAGTIAVYVEGDAAYVAVTAGDDADVDITIHTPANLAFDVTTGGGSLDLSGMSGGGTATTGNGNASLDLVEVTSDLTVTTASGNISLAIPSDTASGFTGTANGGSINIDSSFGVSDEYGTGVATGDFNGGGSFDITLTTAGGDIDVSTN